MKMLRSREARPQCSHCHQSAPQHYGASYIFIDAAARQLVPVDRAGVTQAVIEDSHRQQQEAETWKP